MLQIQNPQIKIISFSDFEKYFKQLLDTAEIQQQRIMFCKQDKLGFTISFSYDMFIIVTFISYQEIYELYKNEELATIEVTGPEGKGDDHPAIKKFKAEYLSRAIPEA
jgi:hypothetical protein